MSRTRARWLFVVFLVGAAGALASSAPPQRVRVGTRVSYISGLTAYLAAGREQGLDVGDSAVVVRGKTPGALLLISAVSSSSASARPVGDALPVDVGDSVVVEKTAVPQERIATGGFESRGTAGAANVAAIRGSVAAQFAGASLGEEGWTFLQPALVFRLNIPDVVGGFDLSVHGRYTYNLGPDAGRFPGDRRNVMRMYTLSLVMDDPSSWYGLGFGRLVSRHVGGIGAFDGGEAVVRQGNFTAGLLAGLQPDYVTSGVSGEHQKFAAFVSYQAGSGIVVPAEFTLAYGQQLLRGRLDRDFVYVQSSVNLGSRFFLSQSSELDLHRSEDGVRKSVVQLTNTYISLSSQVLDWCGAFMGYDATRPVFLLESMKAVPDSLFDRDLYQGFRGGLSFRLPGGVFLMGQASIRSKPDGSRTARSAGGSVRFMDVGSTGVNVGARYSRNIGVYTEGNEIGIDVDRWFAGGVSVALRASRYAYEQQLFEGQTAATTLSASISWIAGQNWYCTGSLDRTWDPLRGSSRVLLEVGRHF